MITNLYQLNVMRNGRFQTLTPRALAYWQTTGAEIGCLLRSETPLPFSAILEAYADYLYTHPERGNPANPDVSHLQTVLDSLVAHGLARRFPGTFAVVPRLSCPFLSP